MLGLAIHDCDSEVEDGPVAAGMADVVCAWHATLLREYSTMLYHVYCVFNNGTVSPLRQRGAVARKDRVRGVSEECCHIEYMPIMSTYKH